MLGSNVRLRISSEPFTKIDGGEPLNYMSTLNASDESQTVDISGINHEYLEEIVGNFTTYTLSMEGTYARMDAGQKILKEANRKKSIFYILVQYDVNEPEAFIFKVQVKKFERKVDVKDKIGLSVEYVIRAVPEEKDFSE